MKQFLLLFLLSSAYAWAQQTDTTQVITEALPEITVWGAPSAKYTAGSRITRLDSHLVKVYASSALHDVLLLQNPLYFRQYGQGQLNSLTFRGSSANHTAVLWNGFSISSPTAGGTDFSLLPVYGFNQVEMQHGPSATNWGSGAIGGSILIGSQPIFDKGWQANTYLEVSRFGKGDLDWPRLSYHSKQLGIRYSNKRWHFFNSLWQNYAQNDFPYKNFTVFNNPEVRQPNAAFRQWGLIQEADLKTSGGLISAKLWYTNTYREAQPAMIEANQGNYRIDKALRLLLSAQQKYFLGELSLRGAFFEEQLNWNGNKSPVKSYLTQLLHETSLNTWLTVRFGAEWQRYEAYIAGNYSTTENRTHFFLLTEAKPFKRLQVNLHVRQSFITDFNIPFIPQIGLNYTLLTQPKHNILLKANVSRAYRIPTLHDRYWIGGGNPDVRPENSWGAEFGLAWQWQPVSRHSLTTEITFYKNKINDWIQWTPAGEQGIWSPQNLLQVATQGIEATTSWNYSHQKTLLKAGVQYYLNSSVHKKSPSQEDLGRQLQYTPLHSASTYVQLKQSSWDFYAALSYVDERWQFGYNKTLEAYWLGNAMIGRSFNINHHNRLHLFIKCNNFLNTQYQTYQFYALPGRNYSAGLRFELHP